MHSNTPMAINTMPDQDMTDSIPAKASSPPMTSNSMTHRSVSPAPTSAPLAPSTSKDLDRDQTHEAPIHHHRHPHSDQQQQPSPTYTGRSPGSSASYRDSYHMDEQPSYSTPSHEHSTRWNQPPGLDGNHPDLRGERYPPSSSPYHHDPYYNGSTTNWSRAPSPSNQGGYKHLSFSRHGAGVQPRSPQPYSSHPSHADSAPQRPYSGSAMPHSPLEPTPRPHHSPESYQTKRHRLDSDSDGYSDHEGRHRHGQAHDVRPHRDREPYHHPPYQYTDSNASKAHGYGDSSREYHSGYNPASAPSDSLPALAPRPPRYSMEDDLGPNGSHHTAQHSSAQQVKKESASEQEPVKIQSARGTPKGPLPIQVQISLLSSVLKHDPFNCAIRKTTQAWELISKEQGIRARTCSRRFDNIIQASIGGRDRPVGTEEQQATKKKLLEQLFEMMNQPQALKRMQKKRRYRSEDTDRRLLLETIRLNPFAQKVGQVAKAWEDVRDALDMKVHARQCIRRVNRMVKPYLLRERMYKGNIPEEMREANDDLVKQVIQLMRMAGQGNTLDDASNDEDSASGMSDSEEHDDPDNDSKGHDNAQEDDELEDDEDEDMASPGGSEQRNARKSQGGSQRSATSPSTPTQSTPSVSMPGSGPSSTSATPAKRGRPRNQATSSQSGQPPSPNSLDRTSQASAHNPDVHMKDMPQLHRSWEGDSADPKSRRPYINGGSEDKAGDDISFAVHGSRPDSPMNSPTAGPHAPGHARHYSNGAEPNDYKRPAKHARTDSRNVHEVSARLDSARAPSPGGSRHSAYTQHGRERDESGYRYGSYTDRAFAVDTHGHPVHSSDPLGRYDRRGYRTGPEKTPDSTGLTAPTAQQYREAMSELHVMRDCLAQMEDQWRAEREKQGSMMCMIEKLQHQMQQQQQHLTQLQQQLRYGYPSQPTPQQPPHHTQHSQGPPGGPPPGGRYSSYPSDHPGFTKNMEGKVDRHESEATQYHVSYSRSEGQYPARDRDPR